MVAGSFLEGEGVWWDLSACDVRGREMALGLERPEHAGRKCGLGHKWPEHADGA